MHTAAIRRRVGVALGLVAPVAGAVWGLAEPAPPAGSPAPAVYGLDGRPAAKPYLGVLPDAAPVPAGGFQPVNAFPKLSFRDPLFLCPFPHGTRLWCVSREGIIWSFENDPNAETKTTVLDVSATPRAGTTRA